MGDQEVRPFSYRDGVLFCENVKLQDLLCQAQKKREWVFRDSRLSYDEPLTPAYVYSVAGIQQNVSKYKDALKSVNASSKIGYAIKANPNLTIVEKMKDAGVDMIIAVSGYEVMAGIRAGFSPQSILLNGNGKQCWEIKLAIENGVMMNVDSIFDARRITEIHKQVGSQHDVRVLLRIRPEKPQSDELQLNVHEYVNTAERSKFGFELSELSQVLELLGTSEQIQICGLHCHFGSCIDNAKVYEWLGHTMSLMMKELQENGTPATILDIGGGIGINYFQKPHGFHQYLEVAEPTVRQSYKELTQETHTKDSPNIASFLAGLSKSIANDVTVIVEPGRSLIGNTGILLCKVLGVKTSSQRRFLVMDGSMNEVIRPCLYGAHHTILPISLHPQEKWEAYDVVGPICESADFLGRNVPMQGNAQFVAVFDTGAYCSSMASTYNLKPRASEILVSDDKWNCIRERETFERMTGLFYPN